MEKLTQKLAQKLQEKIGAELGLTNIMKAMKDKTVEDQIKELIAQDKLKIVDQSNKPLFEKEMQEISGAMKRANTHYVGTAKKDKKITPNKGSV
jgi:uncharacterized protein YbcV (DUF1398 family)